MIARKKNLWSSPLLWGVLGWTALALLMSAQDVARYIEASRHPDVFAILRRNLLQCAVDGLVAILVWKAAGVIRRSTLPSWLRVLFHVPMFFAFVVVDVAVIVPVIYWTEPKARAVWTFEEFLITTAMQSISLEGILYTLLVIAEHLRAALDQARRETLRNAELAAQLADAELQTLRSQLNPHFLFNALHVVSALIQPEPQKARRVLSRLGELLRASLDQGRVAEIPLARELAVLELYLDVQRARFGDSLVVERDIETEAMACAVPPFLLQPLVENAIHHGLATGPDRGRIDIGARVREGRLEITIDDDGLGLPDGPIREGVGISNTRARLEQLYGNKAAFRLERREPRGTRAVLTLEARDLAREWVDQSNGPGADADQAEGRTSISA